MILEKKHVPTQANPSNRGLGGGTWINEQMNKN